MQRRDLAAQEPVGADHDGLALFVAHVAVDHEEVVAERVIFVEVAPLGAHLGRGRRRHFLVEDPVAQALRGLDLGVRFGDADFERAQRRPAPAMYGAGALQVPARGH